VRKHYLYFFFAILTGFCPVPHGKIVKNNPSTKEFSFYPFFPRAEHTKGFKLGEFVGQIANKNPSKKALQCARKILKIKRPASENLDRIFQCIRHQKECIGVSLMDAYMAAYPLMLS
jgi:hypothetical protein